MVREKLEATILPPAVLISHRKSFQETICMSTGECCIVDDLRPGTL